MPKGKFATVVADPAWKYTRDDPEIRGATSRHYSTLTVEEMAEIPVIESAAKDALCIMWTTSNMLLDGKDTWLMKAWGFEPKSIHVWLKVTGLNDLHFGTGYYGRHAEEYFIVGAKGHPDLSVFRSERTLHLWAYPGIRAKTLHASEVHSAKPVEFYPWVEKIAQPGKILEMFARKSRDLDPVRSDKRWVLWGDEA